MSRRATIRMTPDEQATFLQHAPKASLSTLDADGFPHLVAMGFVAKDGAIYMTSYGKAQKVVNVRRNPNVAVMIETGNRYADYRGVMIRGRCEVIDDTDLVRTIMQAGRDKQGGQHATTPSEALSRAPKRVVLKVTPKKIVSWDHTKLGGKY